MAKTKLDPEFKAKWVKELRGDNFFQAQEKLFDEADTRYVCCIGLGLCVHEGVTDITEIEGFQDTHGEDLTDKAAALIGLTGIEVNGDNYPFPEVTSALSELVDMNDTRGKDFRDIANWIEQNL